MASTAPATPLVLPKKLVLETSSRSRSGSVLSTVSVTSSLNPASQLSPRKPAPDKKEHKLGMMKRVIASANNLYAPLVAAGSLLANNMNHTASHSTAHNVLASHSTAHMNTHLVQSPPTATPGSPIHVLIRQNTLLGRTSSVSLVPQTPDTDKVFPSFLMIDSLQRHVQVSVRWETHSLNVHLSAHATIDDALSEIINEIARLDLHSETLLSQQNFILGKVDCKCPGMQVWMHLENTIADYDIQQGDDLVLQGGQGIISEITVTVPPSKLKTTVQITTELTVALLIDKMNSTLDQPLANGELYFPKYGMWLEDVQYLANYNFTSQNTLEFREKANMLLVRIYLCDFDVTIATKALPSQTGGGCSNIDGRC